MVSGSRGRPPLPGPRLASGRRDRRHDRGRSLWQRLRHNAERFALDPRLTTEITRLGMEGELSDRQVEAALLVARIYARYERLTRKPRRHPVSPTYMRFFGDPLGDEPTDPIELDALERRIQAATKKWERLQRAVPPGALAIVERVCCDDERPRWDHLPDLRRVLTRVADVFHVKHESQSVPPIAITARRPPRQERARRDQDTRRGASSREDYVRPRRG